MRRTDSRSDLKRKCGLKLSGPGVPVHDAENDWKGSVVTVCVFFSSNEQPTTVLLFDQIWFHEVCFIRPQITLNRWAFGWILRPNLRMFQSFSSAIDRLSIAKFCWFYLWDVSGICPLHSISPVAILSKFKFITLLGTMVIAPCSIYLPPLLMFSSYTSDRLSFSSKTQI